MKDPAEMSAAAINHELEALDKKDSALTREMIDAGYGHVRFSDTEKLAPEFWPRTKAISDRKRALRIEVEMRAGPGMYRLPRGFGPRKRNPMKNDTGIRLRRMRDTDIYDFFQRWYKRDGHWIYASMGKALEVWKSRGIEGLPPYPRKSNPIDSRNEIQYVQVRGKVWKIYYDRADRVWRGVMHVKPYTKFEARDRSAVVRAIHHGRTAKRRNPLRSGEADSVAARELELFAENDGDLYRQRFMPIIKNLTLKLKKGVYDPEKAVKLWMYFVDDAARKYVKEFSPGDSPSQMFNRATRLAVARRFESHERERIKNGEYS